MNSQDKQSFGSINLKSHTSLTKKRHTYPQIRLELYVVITNSQLLSFQ